MIFFRTVRLFKIWFCMRPFLNETFNIDHFKPMEKKTFTRHFYDRINIVLKQIIV